MRDVALVCVVSMVIHWDQGTPVADLGEGSMWHHNPTRKVSLGLQQNGWGGTNILKLWVYATPNRKKKPKNKNKTITKASQQINFEGFSVSPVAALSTR